MKIRNKKNWCLCVHFVRQHHALAEPLEHRQWILRMNKIENESAFCRNDNANVVSVSRLKRHKNEIIVNIIKPVIRIPQIIRFFRAFARSDARLINILNRRGRISIVFHWHSVGVCLVHHSKWHTSVNICCLFYVLFDCPHAAAGAQKTPTNISRAFCVHFNRF